jgi:dephospho-CoA kinase
MTTRSEPGRPYVIGVTGKIACGKSSVLKILREKGVDTIDADQVYHELIQPGLRLAKTLRSEFGESVVGPDGQIDRKALGTIVFSDPEALRRLDALTHPAVTDEIARRISSSSSEVIAVDGVKLVESGMDLLCAVVWRVTCDPSVQVERLMRRNGISEAEAGRRIASQSSLPTSTRPELAIVNDTDFATLRNQVDAAWQSLPVTRPH